MNNLHEKVLNAQIQAGEQEVLKHLKEIGMIHVNFPGKDTNEGLNSNVDKVAHYEDGKITVMDFIEDKKLDFHLGNAVKYICRAGKKNPATFVEDLQKAIWYLNRKIQSYDNNKAIH